MDNSTFTETLQKCFSSKYAAIKCLEYLLLYFLPYSTVAAEQNSVNQLMLLGKSAFVCWFRKLRLQRTRLFSMHYDFLLLAICFHYAIGKNLDVCGLSCMWSCYLLVLCLIGYTVWLSCIVLYVVALILLTYAQSYYFLLAYVIHILFIYTAICNRITRSMVHRINVFRLLTLVFYLVTYFEILHNVPGCNVLELRLFFFMLIPMLESGEPFIQAWLVLVAHIYSIYAKTMLQSGQRQDSSILRFIFRSLVEFLDNLYFDQFLLR